LESDKRFGKGRGDGDGKRKVFLVVMEIITVKRTRSVREVLSKEGKGGSSRERASFDGLNW
jgi:hypothetical protein